MGVTNHLLTGMILQVDSINPLASIVTFSDDDWGVQSPPKRMVLWVPLSFSEGEPGSLGNISCKKQVDRAGKSPRQTKIRERGS